MNTLQDLYNYSFTPEVKDVEYFKGIFTKYGSDKAMSHTYQNIYSALFLNRNNVKNIIEMGILKSASLKAYSEIFINANIYGMDIDTRYFYSDDRIKCFWADQRLISSMNDVKNKIGAIEFDLIIDDGCHLLEETINSFNTMLPWLSINGWLIVEDIKVEFENAWRNIANLLPDKYKVFLIPMNKGIYDIESGIEMSDNTVFAVHRKF